MKSICVFCGSSTGNDPVYAQTTHELGSKLALVGKTTVFGGGKVGLMGQLADAAIDKGGKVIGVIPRSLMDKEVGHARVSELIVVETMHERKERMYDLSDAFISLPGGFGTLDEFHEILTWSQLGFHSKPIAILNIKGYYDNLLKQFRKSYQEGFITEKHLKLIVVDEDLDNLLDKIENFEHMSDPEWITKDV
jgi:hypothetical protein